MGDRMSRLRGALVRFSPKLSATAAIPLAMFALAPVALGGAATAESPGQPPVVEGEGGSRAVPEALNVREELSALRTENSRTYALADGRRLTKVFAAPVEAAEVELAPRADAPTSIRSGPHQLDFSLVGARPAAPGDAGGRTVYADVIDGVDLTYETRRRGLKETLVLDSADAPSEYRFALALSPGLTPRATSAGGLDLVDDAGREIFRIDAPWMRDAAGAMSREVSYDLRAAGDQYELALKADPAWLEAPERSFPVEIDPTVWLGADRDCTLDQGSPSTSQCSAGTLQVGWNGTSERRALMRFDVRSAVDPGVHVEDAYVALYLNSQSTTTEKVLGIYRVSENRDWDGSATWNERKASTSWTSAGGDFDASPAHALKWLSDDPAGWTWWSVTPLVQSWLDDDVENRGLMIKDRDHQQTDNVFTFASSENSNSSSRPYMGVVWQPRTGVDRRFTMYRERLNERMEIAVNVANGNLVLSADDVRIPGTGLDLNVTRTYNNLGDQPHNRAGFGWQLSGGMGTRLEALSTGDQLFVGPTGSRYLFRNDWMNGGGYKSPAGIDATLTTWNAGHKLKFKRSEEEMIFSAAGDLLVHKDRNGNTIEYQYYEAGNLTGIVDTRGRELGFSYYSTGKIQQLTDWAGRTWTYGYDSNERPTSYTDPAGETTAYVYGSNDDLIEIEDPRGTVTRLEYDSDSRLTAIKRGYDRVTGGFVAKTEFDYQSAAAPCNSAKHIGKTVVTDPRGNDIVHCFDGELRVDKTVDQEGDTRARRYTANGNVDLYTAGSGAESSATYDGSDRLTGITSPGESGNQGASRTFSYGSGNDSFRPDSSTDAQGNTMSMTYTTKGNLSELKEAGSSTAQVEIEYNDGDTGETADDGTVRWSKDGNGNQTSYFYSADGELERVDFPDGTGAGSAALGDVEYTYDSLSRVASVTDGKDQEQTYFYDPLDRIDKIEYRNASGTLVQTIDYSWDENGNLVERADGTGTALFEFDGLNRLTEEAKPGRATTLYSYDAASNLASVTAGGEQIAYTYFPDNTIEAVFEPDPTPGNGVDDRPKTEFRYNDDNSRTETIYPNGVTEVVTFDRSERPKTIKATKSGNSTPLTDFEYRWTGQGSTQERDLLQRAIDNRLNRTTDYGLRRAQPADARLDHRLAELQLRLPVRQRVEPHQAAPPGLGDAQLRL